MDVQPLSTLTTYEKLRQQCQATGYTRADRFRAAPLVALFNANLIHFRRCRSDHEVYVFDRPQPIGEVRVTTTDLIAALNSLKPEAWPGKGEYPVVKLRAKDGYLWLRNVWNTRTVKVRARMFVDSDWVTVAAEPLERIAALHHPRSKKDTQNLNLKWETGNLIVTVPFGPRTRYTLTGQLERCPDEVRELPADALTLTVPETFFSAVKTAAKALDTTKRKRWQGPNRFNLVWVAIHPDRLIVVGANGYLFTRQVIPWETGVSEVHYVGLPAAVGNLIPDSATLTLWDGWLQVDTESTSQRFETGPCHERSLDSLIPSATVPVTLDYDDLVRAYKTVCPAAKSNGKTITLSLDGAVLTVTGGHGEVTSESTLALDTVPSLIALPTLTLDMAFIKRALDTLKPPAKSTFQPVTIQWTTDPVTRPIGWQSDGYPEVWVMPRDSVRSES